MVERDHRHQHDRKSKLLQYHWPGACLHVASRATKRRQTDLKYHRTDVDVKNTVTLFDITVSPRAQQTRSLEVCKGKFFQKMYLDLQQYQVYRLEFGQLL